MRTWASASRQSAQATHWSPAKTPPRGILQRTCACGNHAIGGECGQCRRNKPMPQRHTSGLSINKPGDAFEQEADRIADMIMRMPDSVPHAHRFTRPPMFQRLRLRSTPSRKSEFGTNQRSESLMRRKSCGEDVEAVPAIAHEVLNLPSQPLDAQTRTLMESRFGHDFGNVRLHTDRRASEAAESVHATAYTVGHHVVFGAGAYYPGSISGERLLAHELTHVVQQTATSGPDLHAEQMMDAPSPHPHLRVEPGTLLQRDQDSAKANNVQDQYGTAVLAAETTWQQVYDVVLQGTAGKQSNNPKKPITPETQAKLAGDIADQVVLLYAQKRKSGGWAAGTEDVWRRHFLSALQTTAGGDYRVTEPNKPVERAAQIADKATLESTNARERLKKLLEKHPG